MNKTKSLLFVGGVIVLVISILYSGFVVFSKYSKENDLESLNNKHALYQKQMLEYQNQRILETVNANKVLSDFQGVGIRWSQIIEEIQETIPKDSKDRSILSILSYSGSRNNEVTMNIKTADNSRNPFFDVAELIESFDESQLFADSFVPSISKGVDVSGNEILSFMFSTKYVPVVEEEAPKRTISR
jgi:hypothetical protein